MAYSVVQESTSFIILFTVAAQHVVGLADQPLRFSYAPAQVRLARFNFRFLPVAALGSIFRFRHEPQTFEFYISSSPELNQTIEPIFFPA